MVKVYRNMVECLLIMLTGREIYPRFPRKYPALDGGHYKAGFSFGRSHHEERGWGCETCTVRRGLGELIEVIVNDREVRVDYDDRVSAIYDRSLGVLNCASLSLVNSVLEASRFNIRMDRVARKMKELSGAGSDIVVVVNFDDDGRERVSLVLTDREGVCRPLAAGRMSEELAETRLCRGEEEGGGKLLRAWQCISPIGGIDFCVGLRVFTLDFVVTNPSPGEGISYRVAQELDLSVLDGERISPGLALQLAEAEISC